MLEDQEGILWVGAFGGIAKFLGRAFTTYTEEDGLASSNVRPIVRDHQGDLWVGSHRGVNRFDGATWQTFDERDGLSSAYTRALHLDRKGVIDRDELYAARFNQPKPVDGPDPDHAVLRRVECPRRQPGKPVVGIIDRHAAQPVEDLDALFNADPEVMLTVFGQLVDPLARCRLEDGKTVAVFIKKALLGGNPETTRLVDQQRVDAVCRRALRGGKRLEALTIPIGQAPSRG